MRKRRPGCLFGHYDESCQLGGSEAGGDRDVGGIAAARHHDATDPRMVVASIEGEPLAIEIDLEPRTEIHRSRVRWNADVAEIAGAIARRNVHAAAQGDGEMGEVAADADALIVAFGSGAVAAGVMVAERNALMDIVADRLHPGPSAVDAAEQRPCQIGQLLGIAVATAQQIDQDVVGQFTDRNLSRVGSRGIGQTAVGDQKRVANFQQAGRCYDPGAGVAEHVDIITPLHVPRKTDLVRTEKILATRRMDAQHQYHWRFLKALERDVVARTYLHWNLHSLENL